VFRGILATSDLEIAFAVLEAYFGINLDLSLNQVVNYLARRNPSTTYELNEAAKPVNKLRQSKGIEYLVLDQVLRHLKSIIRTSAGHKRKA
jgi:hypothetical protein